MTAEWTQPKEWTVDELVTPDLLNEQLRDNLEYLLNPNHQRIIYNNGGDYTITNVTTFQDIDSTNLTIDLTTHGGPVLLHLQATVKTNGVSHEAYFDMAVDGVRIGNAYTLGLGQYNDGSVSPMSISVLVTGLAAGTYTFRPQWRTGSSYTANIRSNTSDNPVIFEAIEL